MQAVIASLVAMTASVNWAGFIDAPTSVAVPLIALNSTAGTVLLFKALGGLQFTEVISQFATQQTLSWCGVATAAILLNALGEPAPIDPIYKPHAYFTQQAIIANPCVSKVFPLDPTVREGMSLPQFGEVARCFGAKPTLHHAGDPSESAATFRAAVRASAVGTGGSFIAANFARAGMEQAGGGHFSPVVMLAEAAQEAGSAVGAAVAPLEYALVLDGKQAP
jgi:hypothetical protein